MRHWRGRVAGFLAGLLLGGWLIATPAAQSYVWGAINGIPFGPGLILPAMSPGDTAGIYAGTTTLVRIFQPALAAGGQAEGNNIFVGGAGNSTLTNGAGSTVLASQNVGIGVNAIKSLTSGAANTAFGHVAGQAITSGTNNTAGGNSALYALTTGGYNTALGKSALVTLGSGGFNTAVGSSALQSNSAGSRNIALGYLAGKYELGSDAFYVDNQDRTNTAGDKAGAILYGVMSATPANQTLAINAAVTVAQSLTVTGTLSATAPYARTTMAGTLTLTASSASYQFFDPDGSDRDLVLPTAAAGMAFTLHHFGGANTVTVKDAAAATVTTLTTTQTKTVFYDGTIWQVL